jgi:hypothetical protein
LNLHRPTAEGALLVGGGGGGGTSGGAASVLGRHRGVAAQVEIESYV